MSRAMRPLRAFLRQQLAPNHARTYSTALPNARFNKPMNYETHPLFHHDASSLHASKEAFPHGKSERINLCTAIRKTLSHALRTDEDVLVFGEDISFGGVFRCTAGLHDEFGDDRVFNTPLTEQGIAGFGIGCAVQGMRPVAELQFADYVFPAFDQIVNEAAKWRYREGANGSHAGGLTIRMPCAAVGHGALYHSQSPEALFTHIPGLRVVMPRSPSQAKGLLLASIRCNDPVIFMEPKVLYRGAQEVVPEEEYELPLSKAEVIKEGSDLTIISYGPPLYTSYNALIEAEKDLGISVELIDLRTIYPWDRETVLESIKKTGRAMIVHESMVNAGVGAELAATIQSEAFLHLEAPVKRVAGWSVHTGLVFEPFIIPDVTRVYDAIKQTMKY